MAEKHLETSVEIAASPQRVWRELTNFAKYREWSRFIVAIDGELRTGAHLKVRLDDGRRVLNLKPTLIYVEDGVEMCWEGKLGSSLVFAGRHYFRLLPLPDGYTRFSHGENFRGALVPLLWKSLDTHTRRAFERFNEALRERAESTAISARPIPAAE